MTRKWNDRLAFWNWRSSLVSAALVGMVVVSALGAWSVRASWLEYQGAVERTLDEYATYVARAFHQAQATENLVLRERAMASVTGARAYPDAHLTLARFADAVSRVLDPRVAFADDPLRGFFRIDATTGQYTALAKAADPDVAQLLQQFARERRPSVDTAALPVGGSIDVGVDDRMVVFLALQRSASAEARRIAIYGFTLSWRRSFAPMMSGSWPRNLLSPPSLLDARGNVGPIEGMDTLVAIRVLEPNGRLYYESPRQFTSQATASYTPLPGGNVIHATLHPVLVEQLRGEMLDDDRRQLQLALPILSVLFAIAAILHIRRERELVRARRDFVASVSHELRTPLSQIRMFADTLLLRREESDEERLRWLGIIGREARRLGDLVENILLFSHIDAARVRLEPERTDLGELVEEVVEAYVPTAEARRMRIVADAPSRIFAIVDPRALRQVVVNLIDNAIKYGPAGQTVTVEVERGDKVARLAVSDQGPGVPSADRARLWRPFVRLANAGSTASGSGIGLSVVRNLVQQHGGTVSVEDAEGGGARFVVTLPITGESSGVPAPHAAAFAQR